jgi:hypothetical protein
MNGQAQPFYARVGFYVRPSRTLVTARVLPNVGGRVSALWSGGGRLGVGTADFAEVAPEVAVARLLGFLVAEEGWVAMTPDQIRTWQRTWIPGALRH